MGKILPTKSFDDAISRYERRLKGLRAVRELLKDDPQFLHDLANLARSMNGSTRRGTLPANQGNSFSQVETYFQECGNQWSTAREISDTTEIQTGTISYVLYEHKAKFEKRDHPADGRKKQWRMKGGDGA